MIGSLRPIAGILPQRPPAFNRAPSLTIGYLDTDSVRIEQALSKHRSALNIAGKTSRQSMRQALDAHFATLDTPDLMTKTQERLASQVRTLKERLETRLEAMGGDGAQPEAGSPADHGRRLAGFAISLFNGFLARSTTTEADLSAKDQRQNFAMLMKDAMQDGFDQARSVYGGIEKLDPEMADQLQASFTEAQRRLDQFAERLG